MSADAAWPTRLAFLRRDRVLEIQFDDGAMFRIPFELLRVESPSAEVQGHSPEQKRLVRDKADIDVIGAEPEGRYAIRILFSDGHDSGIFTWDYLRRLGADAPALLAAYRAKVEA